MTFTILVEEEITSLEVEEEEEDDGSTLGSLESSDDFWLHHWGVNEVRVSDEDSLGSLSSTCTLWALENASDPGHVLQSPLEGAIDLFPATRNDVPGVVAFTILVEEEIMDEATMGNLVANHQEEEEPAVMDNTVSEAVEEMEEGMERDDDSSLIGLDLLQDDDGNESLGQESGFGGFEIGEEMEVEEMSPPIRGSSRTTIRRSLRLATQGYGSSFTATGRRYSWRLAGRK